MATERPIVRKRSFLRAVAMGALVALLAVLGYAAIRQLQQPEPVRDFDPATLVSQRPNAAAPAVASEFAIVRAMLTIADVGAEDLVVDLGSGDGRIPIMAAQLRGARGLGVEIDPVRYRESLVNAERAGVTGRVQFRQEDLFTTPLNDATVLTLYLLPEINLQLRPRILSQMRPGSRVVSNTFDMGDWQPDRRETVDGNPILMWVVPARVGGEWRLVAGGEQAQLSLTQRYQQVEGNVTAGGRRLPLRDVSLRGDRIAFTADLGGGARRFEGRVDGGGMVGEGWQAVRTGGG
jgi:SAM-dependent methyltransferase